MSRVAYIRAWPRDPATGATGLVAMAGGGSHLPYWLDNLHYRAGIVREPRFASALGFDEKGWTGAALPTVSTIEFAPSDPALLRAYAALYWKDAAIEVDAGEEYAGVGRILTGTIGEATVKDGRLLITIADFGVKLGKPAIQSWFAGTGGIDGDAVCDGRVKRRSYGYCANVEGRVLLAAHNIYEFGDPARPSQSFPIIRHMGREGYQSVLGWQGSIAATLDALIASSPPQGGGMLAPSINCAKWWTDPTGAPLTADIQGDNSGSYVETAAAIAARLLSAANGPAIVNLTDAIALRPAVVGLHIGDDSETTATALDRLLLPLSLLWRFGTTGQIDIRPWSWSGDAEPVQGRYIGRVKTLAPTKTRRLGYNRNHRQHSDGEIAADILAAGVSYADGTTLEQLKPAEAGSNKTETRTSAAFSGQGALATRNDVIYGSHVTSLPAAIAPGNLIDGNYLSAGFGRYLDGLTLQALRPGEANANVTEGRTAAAFAGQGSLATLNGLAFGSPFLSGFGSLAGLGNLFFGSPYLLEGAGGAQASLSAFKTALGIAGGIFGQSPWATFATSTGVVSRLQSDGYMQANSIYLPNVNFLHNVFPGEYGANVTEGRTAAAFAGQGAFATLNGLALGSPLLSGFGSLAGLGNLFFGSPYLLEGAGGAQASLPAFKTALGTAAAISGQSPWATFSTSTGVVSRLQNDGYMQATGVYLPGANFLSNVFPGEFGANVTEGRTAAAFAGQGMFATLNGLALGSPLLSGFGSLAGRNNLRLGYEQGLLNEGGTAWLSDGMVVTSAGTAAAISGQSPWATFGAPTGKVALLDNNGTLGAQHIHKPGVAWLDTVWPAELGANVTEGRTSAAFAGQGVFATLNGLALGSPLLSGFGSLAGRSNLRLGYEQGLLNEGGTAWLSDGMVVTSAGTAAAISGQSPWATLGLSTGRISTLNDNGHLSTNNIFQNNVGWLDVFWPQDVGSNRTESRTAAAFAGQGTFATQSYVSIDNSALFNMPTRLTPYAADGNYLTASRMAWAEGDTVQAYKPQEPGANATEGRTAAAISGQGGLATRNAVRLGVEGGMVNEAQNFWLTDGNTITAMGTASAITGQSSWATYGGLNPGSVAGQVQHLQGDGNIQASHVYRPGYPELHSVYPLEFGANATEGRTAAAIAGQGPLATRDRVSLGSGGGITNQANNMWLTDGNTITALGTASAVAGQSPWATYGGLNPSNVSGQVQKLQTDGRMDSAHIFKIGAGDLTNFWPGEAGANVTEGRTAAAIAGQTPWATLGVPTNRVSKIDNGGNIESGAIFKSNVGWLDQTWPQEAGSNKTETRTAAGISGQGSLATKNNLRLGYEGGLLNEAQNTWLSDAGVITSYGTASAIAGQSSWATYGGLSTQTVEGRTQRLQSDGYIESSTIYKSGRGFLNSFWAQEGGANVTESRTAAAFAGQGTFATQSYVSIDNSTLFSMPTRLTPYAGDGNYLSAGRLAWAEGDTVQAYKPQEPGSNKTETRTAAAISGQGALATMSQVGASRVTAGNPDNIIPDADYKDMDWWRGGGGTAPAIGGVDMDGGWSMGPKAFVVPAGNFDFFSRFFTAEPGASYKVRVRLWCNDPAFSGSVGAFIHMPGVAWFSLKSGVNNINDRFTSPSDTLIQEYIVRNPSGVPDNANRQWQFRFTGSFTGGSLTMQISITRVAALGDGLVTREDGLTRITEPMAITSQGISAGFAGQGPLATRDRVNLGSGGGIANQANTMWLTDGNTITSLGTAAAITGQSEWATYGAPTGKVSLLDNNGTLAAQHIHKPGVAWLDTVWPAEMGANATEGRTAAAISGQGGLATRNNVRLGYEGGMVNEAQNNWLSDASVITSYGTASAIAGQSSWATYGGLSTQTVEQRTQRLQSDGYIESSSIYKSGSGFLSSFWAQEGGANVTEGRTAAGFAGQGSFATLSQIGYSNIQSYFTLGAMRLDYNITRSDGTTVVTESMSITQLGISAGFAGQQALATRATVGQSQIEANSVGVPVVVSYADQSIGTTTATIVEVGSTTIGDGVDGGCMLMFSCVQDSGSQTDKMVSYQMYVAVNGGSFDLVRQAKIGTDTSSGQTKHRLSVNLIYAVPSGSTVQVFVQARSEQYNNGAASGSFLIQAPTITILGAKR
ncbi:hypothetical protein [uncultured Sphingobium sp.]|uniref:hypothetical protein n=1 Tax=uncultured Sphingobium sp. TaxID=316087 RepID=UPI00259B4615|nr:hypothetical protein [uncultured Sphingobium sp.]